jgi:hemolysin activation/secretion protein
MKLDTTPIRQATIVACLLISSLGASAQEARFLLKDIQLEGASLIDSTHWRSAARPWLGRDIGFADLQAARSAIEAAFHARGWRLVSVRLPAQSVEGGVIRMQVQEPVLASDAQAVRLAGAAQDGLAQWRSRLPALREGQTPNLADLDAQLSLLNEHPSHRAVVAFEPILGGGSGKPGEIRASIRAQQGAESGWTAFMDNTGNSQTGHLRYGLAWRHTNLWQADHQLNVQIVSAPHDADDPDKLSLLPSHKVRIFGANYRIPLPSQAAYVDIGAGYSSVDSGTLAGLFDVRGQGSTASLKYTQFLPRLDGWEPRVSVGLDVRHYDNQVLFSGVNLATPIGVRPFNLGLSASRLAAPGETTGYSGYVQWITNLPGGKNSDAANFIASRAGSIRAYRLFRYGFGLQMSLPGAMAGWSLNGQIDGQASGQQLVSPEQFSAGGASSVRGFASRGIGGDSGMRMQWDLVGRNWLASEQSETSLRPAIFWDAAYAKTNRPTVLERPSSSIASVGLGLRGAYKNTVYRLEVAKAISQRTGAAPVWGAVHFSLSSSF